MKDTFRLFKGKVFTYLCPLRAFLRALEPPSLLFAIPLSQLLFKQISMLLCFSQTQRNAGFPCMSFQYMQRWYEFTRGLLLPLVYSPYMYYRISPAGEVIKIRCKRYQFQRAASFIWWIDGNFFHSCSWTDRILDKASGRKILIYKRTLTLNMIHELVLLKTYFINLLLSAL